jgi:hypothetical protein
MRQKSSAVTWTRRDLPHAARVSPRVTLYPALGPPPDSHDGHDMFDAWNCEHGFAWRVLHEVGVTNDDRARLVAGEEPDMEPLPPDPPGWQDLVA